ncbi:hypothetical protein RHMOL_Rhmol08G0168200 [Rhododendron molle]|uniref:Uncharacterized protein n=1 Tax=Rhododendron molle TaxID=49168 RepID=A0ACC0MPI3_RHOML|nr:hypothetical protein RHMOL_Rhmol08G0168200 [Rhododendron molle]
MVQVPGFFYAMTRKLGQWKLSTMSFAKIGTSSIRHINWRMTIGLFFRASVSGSSIRLCSIKMAVNFCLIGLAQLAAGSICPRLQVNSAIFPDKLSFCIVSPCFRLISM